jgi:uroporphyrinogen-III synthase
VLPRALASRGARVDAVHAYRNRAPVDAGERLAAELALGIDAVLLTSPSTVERLFALLAPAERARLLARVAFACIGPTTADALARALGGLPARAWTAQLQNRTALVDALERGFAEESHGLS